MNKAEIYSKLDNLAGRVIADFQGDDEAKRCLHCAYEQFMAFSVDVTGFSRFDLNGTGQGESYFATVIQVVGFDIFEQLMQAYEVIGDETPPDSEERYTQLQKIFGDEKLGPVARNVVKLWFCGNWYQLPGYWSQTYGPAPKDVTFTVSPDSYVEGLLWTTIGAHPTGAKAPGYGSWAYPPIIPEIKELNAE